MDTKDNGTPLITTENELRAVFDIYLSECQYTKRLSLYTIKSYQEVFDTFQKVLPEVTALEHLHPQILHLFFMRLGTRRRQVGSHTKIGVKPSTTSTYYNKLMPFFRWLEDQGYLSEGYLSKKLKKPPTPVYRDERALNETEINRIVSTIVKSNQEDAFLRVRDLTMVNALMYLGVRRNELLGLRIHDIDFNKKLVLINHRTSKSKDDRYIPLHPVLEYHFLELLSQRREQGISCNYLFTSSRADKPLTKHGLKHWVERYRKLSGVRFHLHRFRHTFACELAKAGADLTTIMKLLGHTSSRMTERYLRSISTKEAHRYIERLNF